MTINYTTLLGLAKPVTGTESGQWGDVVNDQITTLVEDAVANASSISVTAGNVTLTTTTGAANQARMSTLIITGSPGTTRNVVAPSQAKVYVVINQSNAAVVVKGSATTGVTIGAGQTAQIAWNGSDFVEIGNYVHGNFVVNGNLSVNGNSTLGDDGADTTTINGQLVAANSNISKATTLSATAPALAWIKGATYTDTGTAGGTTQGHAPFTVLSAPTLSTSNIVTYTNASTLYVAGAPSAAGSATITNPYAMFVAAGNSYFGGNVSIAGNTTLGDATGDTLTINGTAVSTPNNLNFDSNTLFIDATNNRVGIGTNTPTVTLQVVSAGYPAASVRNTATGVSAYSSIQLTQADTTASGYIILGGNTAANTGLRNTVAFGALTASEVALVTNDYPKFKINANTSAILANSMSPSAWSSSTTTLELATGTNGRSLALYSNGSGALYINNLYNDGTNWLYSKNSDFGAIYVQNDNSVGAHAWYTVAQGGAAAAGTTATLVKQATLGQNGVLTLGDTTYAWQSGIGGIDLRNSGALSSDASYSYLSNNIYYDGANNRRKVLGSVGLFGVGNGASALFMHFQVAGSGAAGSTISSLSTAFAVDTSSRFGINTTSMGAPLSFADAAGDKIQFNGNNANQYKIALATGGTGDAILRYTAGATGAGDHQFYTASSLRFHVTAAGRIAAGAVTTPRYPWSLGGTSGSGISGAIVAVYDNGGATGSGGTNVSNGIGIDMSGNSFELSLYQGNTTGSGGNVTMGQLNTVSGAYTRYAMFNANGMGLATENPSSGVGIKFPASQSASSNANTLDDYEEGSWTPGISGTLGGSYTMGGVNAGKYIKIGKMVYATATLEWTARTTAYSGSLIVTGLPFANGGIRTCGSMGAVSYGLTFNTGYGEWVYLCDPNRSDVYIIENSTTGSGYSHNPVVGTTGLVYALTVCYEA